MGKNNQQRRRAKAKQRARMRARSRNHHAGAGAGASAGAGTGAGAGAGAGRGAGAGTGAAFGFGAAHDPARDGAHVGHEFNAGGDDWSVARTVQWLYRWVRDVEAGVDDRSGQAHSEVLRDLRIPARRAALTAHLTDVLLGTVERLWSTGWEPADLLRIARRDLRTGAAAVVGDTLSLSLDRYAPATVAPRWHEQMREHRLRVWWPNSSTALRERLGECGDDEEILSMLREVVAAADLLGSLPPVQQLEAPPGRWRATTATSAPGPGATPKILERVRALLAKAESTPYEAEAETFTAAAQKLMARHSIDQALLAATHPADHAAAPIARRVGVDRPYEAPKVALANAVAVANRCRVVWSKPFGFITVVGYAQDVTATETLLTSLLLQATRSMTAQGSRRTPWGHSRTRSFRQSFLLAFASRIGQRLQETTQDEVDAHRAQQEHGAQRAHQGRHGRPDGPGPAAGPGAELVAVLEAREQKVQEATDAIFGELRSTGLGSVRDAEGWTAGTYAADAAHLARDPADTLTG